MCMVLDMVDGFSSTRAPKSRQAAKSSSARRTYLNSTSDFAPDSSIDTILLHNTLKPAVRFPNDATYHLLDHGQTIAGVF